MKARETQKDKQTVSLIVIIINGPHFHINTHYFNKDILHFLIKIITTELTKHNNNNK
jgi:hypothetical protein